MQYTERIRSLREDHDYNQTIVANAIHVAQTTYSDYEKGKVRIPLECLIELARFYNVDINYISGVSDTKKNFQTNKATTDLISLYLSSLLFSSPTSPPSMR